MLKPVYYLEISLFKVDFRLPLIDNTLKKFNHSLLKYCPVRFPVF